MELEIIGKRLDLNVFGFSGRAVGKDYTGTAFMLMDKMWKVVKANNLSNKGLNIWIYEPDEKVFAGVELDGPPEMDIGLEQKKITMDHYARYQHVGPYQLIKKAGLDMRAQLEKDGLEIIGPYIEIYGHWTNDETKLETELLMALR